MQFMSLTFSETLLGSASHLTKGHLIHFSTHTCYGQDTRVRLQRSLEHITHPKEANKKREKPIMTCAARNKISFQIKKMWQPRQSAQPLQQSSLWSPLSWLVIAFWNSA